MNTTSFEDVPARRARLGRRLRPAGVLGLTALLISGFLVASTASSASAAKYPSWSDVVKARHSQYKAHAEVTKIKDLVASLDNQLAAAQVKATADGKAAFEAQQAYFAGAAKEKTLQAQVKTAAAKAAKSKREIGEYAAQLARDADVPGGTGLYLFLNRDSAGQVLNDLGAVQKVSEQQKDYLQQALSEQNTTEQLRKSAADQKQILKTQKQAADVAEAAAVNSAKNLQVAVTAESTHKKQLDLELAALTTKKHLTEKQYEKGVRAAAAAGGVGGSVDSAGWALPTRGVITSPWGYRFDPAAGYAWRMHYGDDIADGCLQPIWAAHSGTVSYVGPYGDIGNYVVIQHGGGISTAYGHIANGQTLVHIGQQVGGGQQIARTGSTGTSTGCHLYFQVMVGGNPVNPVPFMNARGIRLG